MTKFRYKELSSVMLGEFIGQGSARKVYHARMNDKYVCKIELKAGSFQNPSEWETWNWVEGNKQLARWFAPCWAISTCGMMLVQRYCEPLRDADLPKRLPGFLCDLKKENFGMMDGRVVCCDYGTVHSAIRDVSRKMVKAEWRK